MAKINKRVEYSCDYCGSDFDTMAEAKKHQSQGADIKVGDIVTISLLGSCLYFVKGKAKEESCTIVGHRKWGEEYYVLIPVFGPAPSRVPKYDIRIKPRCAMRKARQGKIKDLVVMYDRGVKRMKEYLKKEYGKK